MAATTREERARDILLSQQRIIVDPDDDSPLAQARRQLQQGVPEFFKPTPGPARGTPATRARRGALIAVLTLAVAGVGSAAAIALANITANDPDVPIAPQPQVTIFVEPPFDPTEVPVKQLPTAGPVDDDAMAAGQAVIDAYIAEKLRLEAEAAAAAAAAEQTGGGTSSGGSTGGGSTGGGSTGGGGTTAPASPYADSLSFTAVSGAGYIDISADVHTTGSVQVTITATANGTTITLCSQTVNGSANCSGRISDLPGGQTYSVTVRASDKLQSTKNVPVF